MSDPRERMFPRQGSGGEASGRAGMAESLQQALRSLSAVRGQDAGPVTPEMLQELARRAGLPNTDSVADLTRIMGVGADQSVPGEPQYIVFALGDGECALPAESVQGVERVTEITPVPNTVPWVLGVIHLRGAILSVVDLPAFLGLQQRQPLTARSRLLVVTEGEMAIGMMVGGVTEMRSLDTDQLRLPAGVIPPWATAYAASAINLDGRTVIMLDPHRLLYADKMHRYRADFS